TRRRVSSLTFLSWLSTRETVLNDTPASLETSLIVGLRAMDSFRKQKIPAGHAGRGREWLGAALPAAARQRREQQQRDDIGDLDHRIDRRTGGVLVRIADRVTGH